MAKHRIEDTRKAVQALGLTCSWDSYAREFRINYQGGVEATAYYTNDHEDAVGTAQAMAVSRFDLAGLIGSTFGTTNNL